MSKPAMRSRRTNAGNNLRAMIATEQAKIANGSMEVSDSDSDFGKGASDIDSDAPDSDFNESDTSDDTRAEAKLQLEERRAIRKKKSAVRKRHVPSFAVRFSSRASVIVKSRAARELTESRTQRTKRQPQEAEVRMTQAELLREAEDTEVLNRAKVREFESAREKRRLDHVSTRKRMPMVPSVVRWRSVIEDGRPKTVCCVDEVHSWKAPVQPLSVCAVTGRRARYRHPGTGVPFADARAFKILEDVVGGEYGFCPELGVWTSAHE